MAIDAQRAQDLFLAAAEQSETDRAVFLDHECGEDAELRQRVEQLLAAHEEPGGFLNQPAPAELGETVDSDASEDAARPGATTDYQPHTAPGAVIANRYVLQEPIGEGGMGEVWVAKQTEPVKRKVALKLIKAGMDSKAVLQRFEQERQALAMMDHPNIASVLDGGMTGLPSPLGGEGSGVKGHGQPFFVMELVNGLPLTKFCDEAKLSVRERLELFVPICQAVQHAHQKGIVHRDLKPANILITLIDGKPIPKVIDFGVAKATGGKLTDESMSTQFGAVVGTFEYMSPEQAGFSAVDIDTRADVYSLGVILYELLTGLKPHDSRRLRQAVLAEVIRIIQEEEPSKPSTRLSTNESLPSIAAVRQTEPKKLTALLRGELDWVVMKCLEKQRDRRYQTTNALARDVQRYLADEVVEARPPSAGYQLRKFVRRYKSRVIAASVVLLTLLAGIAGTTWGLIEAKRQEAIARGEVDAAEKARRAEMVARKQTQRRLEQIEKGVELLAGMLSGINPSNAKLGGPTVYEQLRARAEKVADELDAELVGDPLVVARLQSILGNTLLELGSVAKAVDVLETARAIRERELGADHPNTLATLNNLGGAYRAAGRLREAIALLERVRDVRVKKAGPQHPDTLTNLTNLALAYQTDGRLPEAIALLERVRDVRVKKPGPDHPDTLATLNNLAVAYRAKGRFSDAIILYKRIRDAQVKKPGPDHPHTLTTLNNLAVAYQADGRLPEAIALLERVRDVFVKKFGADHPTTWTTLHNLAGAYLSDRRVPKAIAVFEQVRDGQVKYVGVDHPDTLVTLSSLAEAYRAARRLPKAIALLEQVRDAQVKKPGPDHPDTLITLSNLAMAYQDARRLPEAIALFKEVHDIQVKNLGADYPSTLTTLNNLAGAYWGAGRLDRSVPLFEQLLTQLEKKLGRGHFQTQLAVANLGVNYKDARRVKEALPLLEEAYRNRRKYASLRGVGTPLLDGYVRAGKRDEAARLAAELLADARKRLPNESTQLAGALASFGLSLVRAKAFAKAEPLIRECLAIREKHLPDSWLTFSTQSMLGGALVGQKKHAEAEPLLRKGYEGMKRREKMIPLQGKIRLIEAVERLVQLYEAMDKKDDAAQWRKELESIQPAPKKTEKKP